LNIKSFFKAPQQFTTKQPENPCEYGRQIWDERDGSYIIQNYNLRRISLCLGVGLVIMTAGLVYESTKSTIEPWIIEVDSTTGEVRQAGAISEVKYTPDEKVITHFIGEFIVNTRSMPLDPVIFKNNWNKAYSFLTKNSAAKMSSMMKTDQMTADFGNRTVQVSITSILPIDGSNSSYQARWTEEIFVVSTGEKKSVPMTGTFTVTNIESKDKAALLANPLGMYFTDFNWVEETPGANVKTQTNAKDKNEKQEQEKK
jgi:type IV secretion system protein VirB5